jgi:hypothetical protein
VGVRTLSCPAGAEPIFDVRSSHLGWIGFDDKAQGITESLAQE